MNNLSDMVFCKKYNNLVNLNCSKFINYLNIIDKNEYLDFTEEIKKFVENENFNIEDYLNYNSDLIHLSAIELINHYKICGKNEERFCSEKEVRNFVENKHFDIKVYKRLNKDILKLSEREIPHHYKNYGKKEGRYCSMEEVRKFLENEDFDLDTYKKYNADLINMSDIDLMYHYKKYGKKKGKFCSEKQVIEFVEDPDFDIDFYKRHNADLNKLSLNELIHHYKKYGKKEGKFCSEKQVKEFVGNPDFNFKLYRKINMDLNNLSFKDMIIHFKKYGKKEGRIFSDKQVREFVGNPDFDIEVYKEHNQDLNGLSYGELINHYKVHGKKENRIFSKKQLKEIILNNNEFNFKKHQNLEHELNMLKITEDSSIKKYYLNENIKIIENNLSSSMVDNIIKKEIDFSNFDINEIESYILIIDFPEWGGGTTKFLDTIIYKYKYYQSFIILRKYKGLIKIILNNECLLKYNNEYYLDENDCFNFLSASKDKLNKIFINHIYEHTYDFINSLNKLDKEITYITHDYFLLFENPQACHDEIETEKNIKTNILINNFENIITQNIGNLNIFGKYINKEKNIIVTELPDYKKQLKKYSTSSNDQIVIGILGYIKKIKGEDFIIELNDYIKSNNLNIKIIVFGYIDNKNIENIYYNSIDHLNELLIKYKPNVIIETSVWQETYSFTLTLAMITKLPILSYFKNYKYVINERLKNYDKCYFFESITDCIDLINKHKQNYFYTIDPVIYYNSFWDNYFMSNENTKKNLQEFNEIINNIDYNINNKIHEKIEPYAIYFPQFHKIPENDILFYNGYTDMENLLKSKYDNNLNKNILTPLKGIFDNYDIVLNNNLLKNQIRLAKRFGIKGFAFYHYWFDHNLFNKENNNIMESFTKKIIDIYDEDFSYFFIWPNEKWCDNLYNVYDFDKTLINKHFNNLIKYFKDKKYKKINNKPVFAILHYYCWSVENYNKYVDYLNKKCIEFGFSGIYTSVIAHHDIPLNDDFIKKRNNDAFYINVPSWKNASMFGNIYVKDNKTYVDYNFYVKNFEDDILDKIDKNKDIILNIFPNFDNYVRNYFKKTMGHFTYENCSIENFKKYFIKIINLSKLYKNNSKIMLINSWNEWGENMAIEPSNEFKYKYLEIIYENLKNVISDN